MIPISGSYQRNESYAGKCGSCPCHGQGTVEGPKVKKYVPVFKEPSAGHRAVQMGTGGCTVGASLC